jgi:hypothetical protein
VLPICCDDVNLDEIVDGISVVRASFPMKYLGISMSMWHLSRVDFQHFEDRVADKLPTYNGKLITMCRGSYSVMPMIMDFLFMRKIWALAVLTALDGNRSTMFTQVQAPGG